jgi:hypothetical protein
MAIIRDASDGHELLTLTGHAGPVLSVTWSPDSKRLATGSRDMTTKVWNAADGRELLTLKGHTGRVSSVSWSRDGNRLATAGYDGVTNLWDAAGAEATRQWARQDLAVEGVLARNTLRGPRAQGFIRDWLLLLPLPMGPAAAGPEGVASQQVPGEASLRPRPGDGVRVGGGELTWREHHSTEAMLDFNAALGRQTELSVVYAVCYVESDRARSDVWLQVGTDDQSIAYLNGREIYRCRVPRTLESLDSAGPLSLEQGTNVLLLKVMNLGWNWEACARLVDKEGRPAQGLRVKLTP